LTVCSPDENPERLFRIVLQGWGPTALVRIPVLRLRFAACGRLAGVKNSSDFSIDLLLIALVSMRIF
jgi:hypothetical protein